MEQVPNKAKLLTAFKIVAIFSIPILGTKIDFWKWIAIIIGFSGAIVIISPSNEIFSIFNHEIFQVPLLTKT